VVALIGVGPMVGEDIAKIFAASPDHSLALMSRSIGSLQALASQLGNGTRAFQCDVKEPETIHKAFQELRKAYGVAEPDLVIYNVRDWHFAPFASVSAEEFEDCWKLATLGLFHVCKEVTPGMLKRGTGTIGITGATANWRGMPQTAAFAPAKAAQRSLAQSLARDLGPKGIHVYLVVVDGVIGEGGGAMVSPSAIAQTHLMLANQPTGAWTFELNLTAAGGCDKLVTI